MLFKLSKIPLLGCSQEGRMGVVHIPPLDVEKRPSKFKQISLKLYDSDRLVVTFKKYISLSPLRKNCFVLVMPLHFILIDDLIKSAKQSLLILS